MVVRLMEKVEVDLSRRRGGEKVQQEEDDEAIVEWIELSDRR